jgi:hypothetical protein
LVFFWCLRAFVVVTDRADAPNGDGVWSLRDLVVAEFPLRACSLPLTLLRSLPSDTAAATGD